MTTLTLGDPKMNKRPFYSNPFVLVGGAVLLLLILFVSGLRAGPAGAKGPAHNNYSEYSFTFVNGVTLSGTSDKNDVVVVGGDSGTMTLHVSCSDIFVDGWASKGSPTPADGSGWQVSSYTIDKFKDGVLHKSCGEFFTPPTTTTTTTTPPTTTTVPSTTVSTTVPLTTTTITTEVLGEVEVADPADPVDSIISFAG